MKKQLEQIISESESQSKKAFEFASDPKKDFNFEMSLASSWDRLEMIDKLKNIAE